MSNLKAFIIFLSIVLLVYGSTNFYLYRRTMQAASPVGTWVWVLRIVILIGILAYPAGRIFGTGRAIGAFFIWTGSFWLAVLVYGVLIALVVDIVRGIDLLTGWIPRWMLADRLFTGRIIFAGSVVLIVILLVGGHIRSLYPLTPEYVVVLPKLHQDRNEYRIVILADTHLGVLVGERRLRRMVEQINNQYPDLVLIVGDLLDESSRELHWAVDPLTGIEVTDGVYAVTGNHEFYAGVKGYENLLHKAGIKLLRDEYVEIEGVAVLVGIDDMTGGRQFVQERVPIGDLLKGANDQLPVILMHHTPTRIEEAEQAGVDLMVSGHIHGGQLWPVKYIAEGVYGVKTGLSERGRMHFYLTSGAGTWGPPVRIGAAPEIVTLVLKKTA